MTAAQLTPRQRDALSACVLWHGRLDRGYGVLRVAGQKIVAHRHVYEECFGPIPVGYVVHHVCENRACVNPEHLQAVSRADHKRTHARTRMTCRQGHVLTEASTYWYRGTRHCKECHRIRCREYRARAA